MRIMFVGALLGVAASACSCSTDVPSWAMAKDKSQSLKQGMVAPSSRDPRLIADQPSALATNSAARSDASSATNTDEYVKPFSKEWYQRREEDQQRLDAVLTICRGC